MERVTSIFVNFINIVAGIVLGLLLVRIVLRLFGASAQAPFVQWVFDTTEPLMHPFRGIFPTPVLDGVFVLDIPALFAMIIYGLLTFLAVKLIIVIDRAIEK